MQYDREHPVHLPSVLRYGHHSRLPWGLCIMQFIKDGKTYAHIPKEIRTDNLSRYGDLYAGPLRALAEHNQQPGRGRNPYANPGRNYIKKGLTGAGD